jgi:hypothetical protein
MNNFVDFWVGLGYNGWLFLLLILLFFAHLIMIILRSTVLTTKKKTGNCRTRGRSFGNYYLFE